MPATRRQPLENEYRENRVKLFIVKKAWWMPSVRGFCKAPALDCALSPAGRNRKSALPSPLTSLD